MKVISKKKCITFLIFALLVQLCYSQDCRTDGRCTQCNLILFYTTLGNYYMYFCDKCITNAEPDLITNVCLCDDSYYKKSAGQCASCPKGCLQCHNESSCTKCSSDLNYQLKSGSCQCASGYQIKNGQQGCVQKPNILMIVLSTIGSLLCMVVGAVLCAVVRMRRGSQQVHAEKKKHRRNSPNVQIQIYEGYDCDMNENSSNIFWNTKSFEYKSEEICSICLDPGPLFMTECGHYFHDRCIYSWLDNKTSCPNCNQEIESKNIRRWCSKCKKILMPVIRNIVIKKTGKKKKQLVQSTPIENQLCDACENDESSHSVSQEMEETPAEKTIIS